MRNWVVIEELLCQSILHSIFASIRACARTVVNIQVVALRVSNGTI
jgi:hypothetical protein